MIRFKQYNYVNTKLNFFFFHFDFLKVKVIIIKIMSYSKEHKVSYSNEHKGSYIFTANNNDYDFKKVDGTLLSFPNNGSKWSLMKTYDNK